MSTGLSVGQTIQLEIEQSSSVLFSRVEDQRSSTSFVIGEPSDGSTIVSVAVDRRVTIIWFADRGPVQVEAVVKARVEDGVRLLEVELCGGPRRLQRRELVRAELKAQLYLADDMGGRQGETPWGVTINVSGGGMLVRAIAQAPLPVEVLARLEVDGEHPFLVTARRVRDAAESVSAYEFVGFCGREHERLIRLVFAQHREDHVVQRRIRAA